MNKKGFLSHLQWALLAMAVLIVVGIFAYKIYTETLDNLSIQNCKLSISGQSILLEGTLGTMSTTIKCPTREVQIRDLKKTNEIIAEDMHRCWYEWSRGDGKYFKGEGVFCHICSIYSFNDKGQEVNGLMRYIAVQPIKVKYVGDTPGISYQDYFQNQEISRSAAAFGAGSIPEIDAIDRLDTSKRYSAVFVHASGIDSIKKILNLSNTSLTDGQRMLILGTALDSAGRGVIIGAVGVGVVYATGVVAATNWWNPVGWVAAGGFALIVVGDAIIYASSEIEPQTASMIVFREYDESNLRELGCEKLEVSQISGRR